MGPFPANVGDPHSGDPVPVWIGGQPVMADVGPPADPVSHPIAVVRPVGRRDRPNPIPGGTAVPVRFLLDGQAPMLDT